MEQIVSQTDSQSSMERRASFPSTGAKRRRIDELESLSLCSIAASRGQGDYIGTLMCQMQQAAQMHVVKGENDSIKFAYQLYQYLQGKLLGDLQRQISMEKWEDVQRYEGMMKEIQAMQTHLLVFLGKQNENELRSRSLEMDVLGLIQKEEMYRREIDNMYRNYVAMSTQTQMDLKLKQDQENTNREKQLSYMQEEIRKEFGNIRIEMEQASQKEYLQAWQSRIDQESRWQEERDEREQWKDSRK